MLAPADAQALSIHVEDVVEVLEIFACEGERRFREQNVDERLFGREADLPLGVARGVRGDGSGVARHLRALGDRTIREERLFAAIERQRDIVRRAAAKTRKARAQHARLQERSRRSALAEPAAAADVAAAPAAAEPTEETAAADADYSGEIWPSRAY